jgi:mono/diheme cytochrome c family protein
MHRRTRRLLAAALLSAGITLGATYTSAPAADEKPVDFKKDIQPIFKASCIKCHQQNQGGPGGGGPGGGGGQQRRPGAPGGGGAGGPGGPGGRGPAGGFRLDDKAAALKGGKAGSDIVPGKSGDSLLFKLLTGPATVGDHEIAQMPKGMRNQPAKPLTPDQVALIKRWIDEGAKWPD